MSSPLKATAIALLGARVAYGIALVIAPEALTRRWLGPSAAHHSVQVPLRGVGVREVAVHGLAIGAVVRDLPVRPLLGASIAGDIGDITATVAARDGLPEGSPKATVLVAGASALLTAAFAVAVDR
jgi:hypothetical protein